MLVLAQYNDPFYVGSDTQLAGAKWAEKLYYMLGQKREVHLRRLHYFGGERVIFDYGHLWIIEGKKNRPDSLRSRAGPFENPTPKR